MSINIAIFGASGRMGKRVAALSPKYGFNIVGALVEPDENLRQRPYYEEVPELRSVSDVIFVDNPVSAAKKADVIVDFALVSGITERIKAAMETKTALVIGTTGLSEEDFALLDEAANHIPVLWAPNMSLGINALFKMVKTAIELLPKFEVEIHEMHHHHKKDAPSGTAVALAKMVAQSKSYNEDESINLCRRQNPGVRKINEIGVVSTRGGDCFGEHTIYLFGESERIEMTHRVQNRDVFAHGALRIVSFIHNKPVGKYTVDDVIKSTQS